jgi:hypothetical protein
MVELIVFLFALAANVLVFVAFCIAAGLAIGNIADNPEFAAVSLGAAILLFVVMQFVTAGAVVLAILGWLVGGIVHGFGYVLIALLAAGIVFALIVASERT